MYKMSITSLVEQTKPGNNPNAHNWELDELWHSHAIKYYPAGNVKVLWLQVDESWKY